MLVVLHQLKRFGSYELYVEGDIGATSNITVTTMFVILVDENHKRNKNLSKLWK